MSTVPTYPPAVETISVPIRADLVRSIRMGEPLAPDRLREVVAAIQATPPDHRSVYVDRDGDLWIVGSNGLLGVVCGDAPEELVRYNTPLDAGSQAFGLVLVYEADGEEAPPSPYPLEERS